MGFQKESTNCNDLSPPKEMYMWQYWKSNLSMKLLTNLEGRGPAQYEMFLGAAAE